MTITLPTTEDQHRPLHRVLVSQSWANASWSELPMAPRWDINRYAHGFEVIEYERCALPKVGQASFLFHFGNLNGRQYGANGGQAQDLTGWYVRIQIAEAPLQVQQAQLPGSPTLPSALFAPAWRTVWLGRVEQHEDRLLPGASYAIGTRTYHCLEIIAVSMRWPLLKHGFDFGGDPEICRGNPGYNRSLPDGSLQGTKGSSTIDPNGDGHAVRCRTYPGQGSLYTDMDVCNDAIVMGRQSGDPIFLIAADYGLLQSAQAWEVTEQKTVFDVLASVLRRQRGRGLAYVTWGSDLGSPTGPLTLALTVVPQTAADIVYQDPVTAATVTIQGANNAGTAISLVDLVGDHRNVDSTFQLGSRYQNKWDYVETVGDEIEVFVTLSYQDGTLEKRWTVANEAAFLTAATNTYTEAALATLYEAVYQLHSPPALWKLTAGNGTGLGSMDRIDVRCLDNGQLQFPTGTHDTSPVTLTVMRDTVLPSPGDQAIGVLRGDPLALVAPAAGSDLWLDVRTEISGHLAIKRDNGILLKAAGDEEAGQRYFSDTTQAPLGAVYNYTQLAFSLTIKLPHRLRFADGDPAGSRRHPPIYCRDQRLWLVHNQAITHLDLTTGDVAAGHSPMRGDQGTPIAGSHWLTIRDNRSTLARLHALNWSWYGTERRTATWQLRAIGSLGVFTVAGGAQVTFPQLGYVVQQLAAAGTLYTLNTPITMMHVQVQKHLTTWETDWCDRDQD